MGLKGWFQKRLLAVRKAVRGQILSGTTGLRAVGTDRRPKRWGGWRGDGGVRSMQGIEQSLCRAVQLHRAAHEHEAP